MTHFPRLTLASGPVDVSAETLRAMQKPVVYHYDPVFLEIFAHTTELMAKVFQTEYDIVLLQAEAIAGLEAAAASVIEPGTKVLNLVSGVFGKGFESWIEAYGGETIEIAVPYNQAIDPEDVRRAFQLDPSISVVSVVHSETPSGTINPIKEIGRIAHEHGAITIVDTVSGLLSEDLSPEEWGMDIAVAGPQKCLSGVPGMSLIAVSPAAWERMESLNKPLRGSFLSLLDWKSSWVDNRRFPYTPSVSDVYALESVLQQTLDEGVANIVARHQVSARATRAAVRALRLEIWAANDAIATACCTAVKVPEGIDDATLRGHMRSRYGVMISGGYGSIAGKLFRLGHMGLSAHPTSVIAQIGILERSLLDLGLNVQAGAGVAAALAEFSDWDDATYTYA
ncbi:MAG: alanine--glyoxylate aminotransferase family protein [Thermomicrobiales bacterium]|nr:alanine--glyoxylate aminotransferase family protein [Thermomicrobiales bacterium]MCO5218516.1 alanine--glyoxylate aminotransferase family protein [Thermomicrobiales bacterium]MCO5224804.1 alanine--glyoxylate aminotransferase family protein [Thermomicrobiales bacterium]MCO5227616.1 alanine--glyoxylate aminotransferase family protein [Thermomicrobiales bacterium]